jgi:hypothetical protein
LPKNRGRTLGAAALAAWLAVSAGPVLASPTDTAEDLVFRLTPIEEGYGTDVVRGLATGVPQQSADVAPSRPWDNMGDFCLMPDRPRHDLVGTFFAAHVNAPTTAAVAVRGPQIISSEARAMDVVNANLARQMERLPQVFPPPGRAQFLGQGQSLGAHPATWGQAAAQRAEWALVLHDVGQTARGAAAASPDFEHNYLAVIWTALECDLIAGHSRFLAALSASGETISDPRQLAAVQLLQRFVTPASGS